MPFLNKIFNFFSKGLEKHYESDVIYKVLLVTLYSILGAFLSLIYSIIKLLNHDYFIALIFFVVAFFTTFNFLFLKKKKTYFIQRNIATFLFTSTILLLVIIGDFNHIGLYWSFIFPSYVIYLFDYKRGTLFSILFLLIISIGFFFHIEEEIDFTNLKFLTNFWFLVPFFILTGMVYIYEFVYEEKQKGIENDIIKNQKTNTEKDEVLTKISYQIRTPLNNILGLKNILELTELDEIQKDILNSIEASIGNLNHVIEQVDSASGLQIDTEKHNLIAFNLKTTIIRTIDFYQNLNKNIKIDFSFSDEIPMKLFGNPVAVKQIFINLIELALKNVTDNIRINIKAFLRCQISGLVTCNFLFEILDNIEIKKSIDIDKILEYSIVRLSVEKLYGKIKVFNEKNSTVFDFFIELEDNLENVNLQEIIVHPGNNENSEKINSLKDSNILVVEDNDINQKVIELSLKKLVKNIDFANNGKEALDLFGKNKYNLIIMDIQMPVMDGFKATQKIREAEIATKTHTPIIAITANALIHDKKACLEAGMDDYISKPYKIQDVIEKIRNLLIKN